MDRIYKVFCSCGGTVEEIELTDEEDDRHNCLNGCCAKKFECIDCKVSWIFELESPEKR